ncbi:hypothetical protein M9Y10_025622 [Tritrichomonas musculus]|uniref:Microbial-type PARG catalytic domain-containing protein n=1 Tax=Tritrichomonas musculus TaxID=1915356 RepID=A0ABR2H982_9EUKA
MENPAYPTNREFLNKLQYEPGVDYLYRPFYQPNVDYIYKPVDEPGIDYVYKPNDRSHYGFLYEEEDEDRLHDYLRTGHPTRASDRKCCNCKKCYNSQPCSTEEYLVHERKSVAEDNIEYAKRFPFLVDKSHVETISNTKHQKISRKLGVLPTYEFSTIYVEKCTSYEAVMDAYRRDPKSQICVLNFASPVTPGGEFRNGQPTQEASLCRHTLLYPTLEGNSMYNKGNEMDGSDVMIYSPNVSVFRDTMYKEIVHPFKINVISATPVDNRKCEVVAGPKIMERRIRKIINLAASKKPDVLILGAFGCGALKNDPKVISKIFQTVLVKEGMRYHFPQIIFPVSEDPLIFDIFRSRFPDH